uniref:Uncharacterized protein n=1 Tax=Solanum lycopersicum TaxID=4081 RepID=A0A494G9S6_SOLLC
TLRNTQEAVASYIDFVKRNLADESSFVVAKVPDIQHKLATIVSLKERAGDTDVVFDSAIKRLSNVMTEDNKLNTIMQETATVAHADIEEGEAYDKQIKPLPDLEKTSGAKKGPNVGATNTNEEKRKPKYPKVFYPTNPKRWFPKREMSSYRRILRERCQ